MQPTCEELDFSAQVFSAMEREAALDWGWLPAGFLLRLSTPTEYGTPSVGWFVPVAATIGYQTCRELVEG